MRKTLKSILASLLAMALLVSSFSCVALGTNNLQYETKFIETCLDDTQNIYKLSMYVKGFEDTYMITANIIYDSSVIMSIDASAYKNEQVINAEAISKSFVTPKIDGKQAFNLTNALKYEMIDNDIGFNINIYNLDGYDISKGNIVLEWYYKVSDVNALNKSSIRFPANDSELSQVGNGINTAAIIISAKRPDTYACYKPHSKNTEYANAAQISVSLIYTGTDKDILQSISFIDSESLTLAIPALGDKQRETATLNLSEKLKKTGLSGDYTGNVDITWSMEDINLTGAEISEDGVLTVDNLDNAGIVTITATVDGVSAATTTVTIIKEKSVATTTTITGVDGIIVPSENDMQVMAIDAITEIYTATVKDQYGKEMPEQTVIWSIEPSNLAGISIDSSSGALSVDENATNSTVTIKATVGEVFATKEVTVNRDTSVFNVEILDENDIKSNITPIDGYTIIVPVDSEESNSITLYARGDDKYGNEIPKPYIATWENNLPAGYVTNNEDNSITINVPTGATINETGYDLTAIINGKTKTTKIKLTDKIPLEVDMSDITITGAGKEYDGLAVSQIGQAKTTQSVNFDYNWYDVINNKNLGKIAPINAGSYKLIATINDETYTGYGEIVFEIIPKPVIVTIGDYTITKVYDKTTNAGTSSGSLALSNVVSGDESKIFAIIETIPAYTNANAGSYNLNAIVSLTGEAASNYTLNSNTTIQVPATIIKADIEQDTKAIISGFTGEKAQVGNILTVKVGDIDSSEFTYQWYRGETEIASATNDNYTLNYEDSNKEIHVVATVKADGNYNYDDILTSDIVTIDKIAITGKIILEFEKLIQSNEEEKILLEPKANPNAIAVGDTINATANIDNGIDVHYQWYVAGKAVEGKTGTSYTVEEGDTFIYVVATPVSKDYTGSIKSTIIEISKALLTGTLTIAGENSVGSELTATLDNLIYGTDYTLSWLRDGVEIATSEKYTITKDDKGHIITVKAVAAGNYTGEIISTNNIVVAATAPYAPKVTATAGNGQVTLNWTAPNNGGSPITGYTLKYYIGDDTSKNVQVVENIGADQTSFVITNLVNGTNYSFDLRAINALGISNSVIVKATPVMPTPDDGNSDSSSSGGSNSGGSTTDNVSSAFTSGGSTTVTTTQSTSISNNTAKAEVTTSTMDKAVTSAISVAKENNTKPVVEINIDSKIADNLEITLPKSAFTDLAETVNGELIITSDIANITVNSIALENILENAGSKFTLNIKSISKYELNLKQQSVVGDFPVFDFSFVSGNDIISNFGSGTVTITIPYTLPYNLDEDKVTVYHIDDMGDVYACNTTYNSSSKTVTFTTNHFSKYFIGYDNSIDITAFYDVSENRWSAEYIYDLYNRGIINGLGNGIFAPEKNITRAEFVKILAGVTGATSGELNGNFTDVQSNSWYAGYVAWAVNNGVTSGTSDTTFSPDANITREQMATMIYRFTNSKDITLPKTQTAVNFIDVNTFSDWAVDAISAMQRAGIINGFDDNSFAPANYATREQACKMLALLLDIIED